MRTFFFSAIRLILLATLPLSAANQVVTSTNNSGAGSLRQAIIDVGSGESITFASSLNGATINLSAQLVINKDLNINASALSKGIIIDGSQFTRVFEIRSGAIARFTAFTITGGQAPHGSDGANGSLITGNVSGEPGDDGENGGGIRNLGKLTLNRITLRNCIAGNGGRGGNRLAGSNGSGGAGGQAGHGGGIYNASSGVLVIENSTIIGNSAGSGGNGGTGLFFQSPGGTGGSGGGIYSSGGLVIDQSTITNNVSGSQGTGGFVPASPGNGGGVSVQAGNFTLDNSVIALNTSAGTGADINGTVSNESGINFVGTTTGATGLGSPLTGDPMLGDLADNGGPTLTREPLSGSPLINPTGGDTSSPFSIDQRGVPRIKRTIVDIGAVEAFSIVFVDHTASGNQDGTSWGNAFLTLQDALATVSSRDQIWVAAGTYRPTSGSDRTVSFVLPGGVAIYGGFSGNETSLGERDPQAHVTILSGDLNGDDGPNFTNNSENSYHVVRASGVRSTAILDGLTITAGNANLFGNTNHLGGGLYLANASPTIANCSFVGNRADDGGGICNDGSSSPTISNCSFTGNHAEFGGGIFNDVASSPALINCSFAGNSASSSGGGIFNDDNSLSLSNCSFAGNSASSAGGGIYNAESSSTITNCTFAGNSAGAAGGGIHNLDSSATLTNCSFTGNSASGGAGISTAFSSVTITNCSLVGNKAAAGGGGGLQCIFSSILTLTNCVIWNNESGSVTESAAASILCFGDSLTASHCLIENWSNGDLNNLGGSANYDGTLAANDPRFVFAPDPSNAPSTSGDLRLRSSSPAINAGLDAANSTSIDLGGNPRLNGVIDLGAYEHTPATGSPYVDSLILTTANTVDATTLEFTVTFSEIMTGFDDASDVSITTTGSASYSGITITPTFVFPLGTQYKIALTGVSGEGDFAVTIGPTSDAINADGLRIPSPFTLDRVTRTTSRHYVVEGNPNATAPYETWATAAASLQDALAIARSLDKIWVAAGTYHPTSGNDRRVSFELIDGVAIYGGFAGNETSLSERSPKTNVTILSGDLVENDGPGFTNNDENSYHVVVANNVTSSTVLDGLTITAGNANGGSSPNNIGGGLYLSNASATIINCSFEANSANQWGGGVYSGQSSPTFTNCSFLGNLANSFGGGIHTDESSTVLTNCAFLGNSASTGGGMYNTASSSSSLVNGTFAGNAADQWGGAIFNGISSSSALTNCLIWKNQDSSGIGTAGSSIFNFGGSATYSYCLVQGLALEGMNYSGTNPANDPLFASVINPTHAPTTTGDLRLLSGSPVIDKGNNIANSELLDLTGNPRKIGTIDLGAYEGAYTTFPRLYPGLNPNDDDNMNGITNYGDYAAGLDPTAPHNPSGSPKRNGNQITFSYRNYAADVFLKFSKSTDLTNWIDMLRNTDYTISNSTTNGAQTLLTLQLIYHTDTTPTLFHRAGYFESE